MHAARGTLWVVWLALCFELSAEETVTPPPAAFPLFSMDAPAIPTTVEEMLPRHMRTAAETNSLPSAPSSNNVPSLLMSFNTSLGDGEPGTEFDVRMERLYRKLDEGGHLERRHKSDSRLARAMDAVFSPEVIQIGATQIAFSPYTAIRRKNPFCLLNPVPIAVSW